LGKVLILRRRQSVVVLFGRRWWSVSPRSSVSLCEKAHPLPPTTHQSSHPRRRRHPTKTKTKKVVLFSFRSFSARQTKERSTTTQERVEFNNLLEKRSSFSSRFNCCLVRRFINEEASKTLSDLSAQKKKKKKKESKRKC